jgi:hypothetical protein
LANHLPWGIFCAFATHWILSCDVGGAYRQKAATLAGSGLTLLVAYVFAGWMVQSVANYIFGTFLWVFPAALIGVAGNPAAQAGLVSSTVVVTSVLAAISDYPTRESVRLESDDLTRLIDALAKALDDLAASLKSGTEPRRLADLSEFSERLEKDLHASPQELQEAANLNASG